MPALSVVIPSHRRPSSLKRLLVSLEAQSLCEFELVVVTNLPEEAIPCALPVRWHAAGELGVNFARNFGIERSRGGIILFLDDDTEAADKELLKKHLDFHRAHPEISGYGGGYALPPGQSDLAFAYHLLAMAWLYRFRDPEGRSPHLIGGHASYKREVFEEGHRFDPGIRFGGAETDFNLRLVEAGKLLHYDPDLRVNHYTELSWRSLFRKGYLQGRQSALRRHKLRSPLPAYRQQDALEIVRELEPDDRGGHCRVRLACRLYEWGFEAGCRSVGEPDDLLSRAARAFGRVEEG